MFFGTYKEGPFDINNRPKFDNDWFVKEKEDGQISPKNGIKVHLGIITKYQQNQPNPNIRY